MRNTCGLPFNAPYACTGMHQSCNRVFEPFLFQQSIPLLITNSTRGWPLLGLLTLPTAGEREKVSEENETQAKQAFMHACLYSNQSISPLIIVQSSNLSLYLTFELQHGVI